jgi:UPF0271 protein
MEKIDINVDMGESFGRYKLGNDEEVMKYISSANIACGFHASDPLVMNHTVKLAEKYGVAVGAHTGLRDLQGFGRREMKITPEELKSDTVYQIGALDGFLKINNMKMQHVKPHGTLYRMVEHNEVYAEAYIEAVSEYNRELIILAERGTVLWEKGIKAGLRMAAEVFVDLGYDAKGNWIIEREKKARTPQEIAERAISVVKDGKIATIEGKLIDVRADTICCHGDAPNAADIVKKVREEFKKQGITVANLSNILT